MVSFQFYLQLPCSLDHADVFQAAITLFPLAYFLLCTGPVGLTELWSPWVQIGLDAIFIIFWIVAEALSTYDCNSICSNCSAGGALVDQGYGFYVYVGSLFCECVFDYDVDGGGSLSKLFRRAIPSSAIYKTAERAWSIAAKQGLDGTMM
jgi:hypothetical protein